MTVGPAPILPASVPSVLPAGWGAYLLTWARFAFGPSPLTNTGWLGWHDLARLAASAPLVAPAALLAGIVSAIGGGHGVAAALVAEGGMIGAMAAMRFFQPKAA